MTMSSHLGCLIATMVSLTYANTITSFCPMTTPLGENLYDPGDSSNAIAVRMISECALNCFRSANCNSFSYNETSQLCVFIVTNRPYVMLAPNDSYTYQMEPDRFVGSPGGYPVIDAKQCSYPFTHSGQLYYRCFEAVADPANMCNRYACLLPHRQYATCRPPVDFVVLQFELQITVHNNSDLMISLVEGTFQTQSIGGWILIHQNLDDSLSFNKTWSEYRNGFGSLPGNYWMGLENVRAVISLAQTFHLRVEVQLESRSWYSAEYDSFSLGSETASYPLSISGYSGDIDDPLRALNGMKFSTPDQVVTGAKTACQIVCKVGWWYMYNSCLGTNFNGHSDNQPICFGVSSGTGGNGGPSTTTQVRPLSAARMMVKAA